MSAYRTRSAWAGWVAFAGVMLLVTGTVNIIEGIVALVNDEYVVYVEDVMYLVDISAWGGIQILFGALLFGAGVGILTARTWARILSIVLVALHASLQILWIGTFPLWSLLMIALDVVILYALTARWSVAVGETDPATTSSHRPPAMAE